jgi:hypothetical protein
MKRWPRLVIIAGLWVFEVALFCGLVAYWSGNERLGDVAAIAGAIAAVCLAAGASAYYETGWHR